MQRRNGKKIVFYLFLLILLGSIQNISFDKLEFDTIKKINVSGLSESSNEKVLKEIKKLNLENIFFLNGNEINRIIESNTLVESYNVFKKYPFTIDIKLKKTNFLAKINLNDQLFFIGSNGKLIDNFFLDKDLPYIFGRPEIDEFLKFKKIIDGSKLSYKNIKSIFYFKSKRWDIKLKNNILIKLPKNNLMKSLDDAYYFLDKKNFNSIKIIDTRIENQIIINE